MHVEVFRVVVVGNLFTRFDISFRKDKDPFLSYIYFAIRGARMIDESRRICTDIAINREFFIDFEKIFAGVCLYLGSCGRFSLVFNNTGTPLNWFFCEEPAAAWGSLNMERIWPRSKSSGDILHATGFAGDVLRTRNWPPNHENGVIFFMLGLISF